MGKRLLAALRAFVGDSPVFFGTIVTICVGASIATVDSDWTRLTLVLVLGIAAAALDALIRRRDRE